MGTQQDPVLSSVLRNVRQGWSNSPDSALSPFYSRCYELSVQDGCLLWGSRVIVPPSGRKAVLNELHEAQPGISRMKALARMYVWWPGLDKDIEESVRLCRECQVNQASPPVAPLHPLLLSTPGSGHHDHGQDCTLIMQVQYVDG